MREPAFLRQNADKWKQFESLLSAGKGTDPDHLADLFIQLTDDLSYARTFFPGGKTALYLNNLAGKVHQRIYRNRRERKGRIIAFWRYEMPEVIWRSRRELLYSATIFLTAAVIGVVSASNDDSFVRIILGDAYVNMTLDNIARGDALAVYKSMDEGNMFLRITLNNIWVSLQAFAYGIAFSVGTAYFLFFNGVMVGSFQCFFFQQGVGTESLLTIWIHGTLEISAIIIAGAAGITMGNSILFPGTYSRVDSLMQGAKRGLKIVMGLTPIFTIAAFLEAFITRHNNVHPALNITIIALSLCFVIGYFVIYPYYLHKNSIDGTITKL